MDAEVRGHVREGAVARILADRVRTGELDRRAVALAARLGHRDARRALGDAEDAPVRVREVLRGVPLRVLWALGREALEALGSKPGEDAPSHEWAGNFGAGVGGSASVQLEGTSPAQLLRSLQQAALDGSSAWGGS